MAKFGTSGSIILIASMSGSVTNIVGRTEFLLDLVVNADPHNFQGQHWVAYNTSKSAVIQMARSMACELGPAGIRVNSLSPGYIYTA